MSEPHQRGTGRLGAISKPRNPALQLGLNPPEVTEGL